MSVYVGYAATVTTVTTLVPQIVKVVRTRKSDDLAYSMILLNLASSALWCAYGVLEDQTPMVVAGSLTAASGLILLALKWATGVSSAPEVVSSAPEVVFQNPVAEV